MKRQPELEQIHRLSVKTRCPSTPLPLTRTQQEQGALSFLAPALTILVSGLGAPYNGTELSRAAEGGVGCSELLASPQSGKRTYTT